MNLPPRKPRFSIPISGARVGSVARPVADRFGRESSADQPAAESGLGKPRFGLRAHASSLRVGPSVDEPTGPVSEGGEVA